MSRLLLIDGNAILHRAYHAYPPNFTDKEGKPTNAIYGFFAMLLKLLEEVKPEYLAICFDHGAPTFKMNMYAGYHENRPKMKDDLASQVPRLHQAIEEIGIPLFGVDGYEADDLLGTLAFQAVHREPITNKKNVIPAQAGIHSSRHSELDSESLLVKQQVDGSRIGVRDDKNDLETVIVTGDRDLLQLVNKRVKILMPLVGVTKTMLFDEDRVEEKYGVRPDQFIDYKALVGDASDNYPGVTGIGPKTASGLLQKYGSFENLYKKIGDLPPQIGEKLATDAEQAALAKKLATIHLDAPIHLKIEDAAVAKLESAKFVKVFDSFGFESLKKRVESKEKIATSTSSPRNDEKKSRSDSEQLGFL